MRARHGFTLVEMLVVIAMIGLLMAMISGALYQAQKAVKTTRAETQLREVIAACGQYYLVEKKIPTGMEGGGWVELNTTTLHDLVTPNSQGLVYLNLSEKQFKNENYVDPWNMPYQVKLNSAEEDVVPSPLVIKASVTFINHKRE